MQAVYSLGAVGAVIVAAALAGQVIGGNAWMSAVAYAGFAVFLAGFCYRVVRWAAAPVPFRIPTTCGQQRSLPWIKSAALENPSTTGGVLGRMALEVFLFRSLFRNNQTRLDQGRAIFTEQKYLWLAALAFHWSLLTILVRHLRLLVEPVPAVLLRIERVDGFFQLGAPPLYLSDLVFACALAYLLLRRFQDPVVRYISQFSDYFALLVFIGIAASGMLMRYVTRVDVVGVKQFALGLAAFHPVRTAALGSVFAVHLALISVLAAYFPFSKLMHMGGVFLSPTRNLANNNRATRHINPWNYPVKTHSYAEWEEEFRDKLRGANLPLEADHATRASAD
ncbi:MAG: sulfate reduction electron transfer complex DsrMKJOP subunit DsrM [Acidobacteriia bacterium]|nr:sulfate reduction electron transfer complex DsrMKJOP subunit DsrM [Terriglobia bacterium]